MQIVILTALGVGGATVIGATIGFLFKNLSHKFNDIVLSFAAGIMLAAAFIGLVLPSLEYGGKYGIITTVLGIFVGAVCMKLIDKLVPHLHKMAESDIEPHARNKSLDKVLLFVLAIAIHNLPEGMAAGVAYGGADIESSLGVIFGIALHNLPEGVIAITPLIASGVGKGRAMLLAASGAIAEVAGTLIGYMAVSISEAVLPFLLSFAGGTMLTVIAGEMIPEAKGGRRATMVLILGFSLMVLLSSLLG